MVRAYWLLSERGDPDRVYLACAGRSRPIRDLIDRVAALARCEVAVAARDDLRREGEQPDMYGSPAALAAETGWRPQIPIETTIADTLEWWRAEVAAGRAQACPAR
jgi:GDP-4-dehydro-6-deoxy-D-mannose reductase